MTYHPIEFARFKNCIALSHLETSLIVTTDVGPRILYYGRDNSENHLFVKAEHQGIIGNGYRSYGGHRMWLAPEDPERTYQPDSTAVEVEVLESIIHLKSPVDTFGIQKCLSIQQHPDGFLIHHQYHNRGLDEATFAPWAVTVMKAGGTLSIPLHPIRPQSENLLPVTPLILWGYTDLSDERYQFAGSVLRLRQLPETQPTKIGARIQPGIAAYTNFGETFVKQWTTPQGGPLTDLGCNFEAYTRHDMLEVESLGVYQHVAPNSKSTVHTELWSIEPEVVPTDPNLAYSWLIDRATFKSTN